MNLLHLEDNDVDADLFAALLEREWPEVQIRRMWTRDEFESAVQREHFDLILSDHSMPGFDGMTALQLAHQHCPDTPFIFLSGTIGEDRAIEALKNGAADYVLKNAPARFVSAVRSAIVDAERERARRDAERSLQKNREQFRQIAENIDDFIVLLDARGHCLYSNPAFPRLLHRKELAPGGTLYDYVHSDDRANVQAVLERVAGNSGAADLEFRVQWPDHSIRHLEARISLLRHRDADGSAVLLSGRDVTERKRAECILHEQASLLGKARDAVCLMSLEGTITKWNASAERVFGHPEAEVLGRNAGELLFREQARSFEEAMSETMAEGEWQQEFRLDRADGSDLILHTSWTLVGDAQGRPQSILLIGTDVTSRRQLEMELQRSQRIEGLGMLAGGVAHDLNNVLSPILMSVDLLRTFAETETERSLLDTLKTSAIHGSELVQQILTFARGGEGEMSEVRIDELLTGLKSFLKAGVRGGVDLTVEKCAEVWPITADATQLKQVLMNLCVNARDAMPKGGRIRIGAANVDAGEGTHHGFHGEIPAGRYVRLSVADTGTGIPPEVLEKIFDPFFTTKPVGKGTGLGLSTIMGIVQKHRGAIQVDTGQGEGTTFHLYLPAEPLLNGRAKDSVPEELPVGRGETVLIVDDDDGICFVAEQILTSNGYRVLKASNGRDGLMAFRQRPQEINVVICDQLMPGMNGTDVLRAIHREAPGVKLLATSGLGDKLMGVTLDDGRPIAMLPKPLNSRALLLKMREVLDARAG